MSPERVSVVMATYNGARWVEEQLASILDELEPQDEVVVVDDASSDDTVERVERLSDARVRVVRLAVNRGYVSAFERALTECDGDVVLLADQDDVWVRGRRALLVEALAHHRVVASNVVVLGTGRPLTGPFGRQGWRLRARDQDRHRTNVLAILAGGRPYYGCAMGVRREALDVVLPFPGFLVESHDLWLALYGNLVGDIAHVEDVTLERRVHESNASPDRPRGVVAALASRRMLLRSIRELRRRIRTD